jgi:Mor family transcriptional regulator
MSRSIKGRQGDVIEAMMRLGVPALVRVGGLPADVASTAMREAIHAFCIEFGGDQFYMPRDVDYPLLARDREIFDLFDGTNTPELGRAFRLSERQVRFILHAEGERRARASAKQQTPELPGLEVPP